MSESPSSYFETELAHSDRGPSGWPVHLNRNPVHLNRIPIQMNRSDCPICVHNDDVKIVSGVVICVSCGSELGPEIQNGASTQYGESDDFQYTNIHNPLLEESNYSTSVEGNSYFKKLNQWSHVPYKEKMLAHEFKTIDQIVRNSGLELSIAGTAQLLYKEAICFQKSETDQKKKRKVGLLEACLYNACVKHGKIHSHREIAQFCGSTETRVIRGCKSYFQLMKQDIPAFKTFPVYLSRFSDSIGLTDNQQDLVRLILDRVIDSHLLSESPPSIVAGCLYLASVIYNFRIGKATIAIQCDVSEVTIAKIYKKLLKILDKLIE